MTHADISIGTSCPASSTVAIIICFIFDLILTTCWFQKVIKNGVNIVPDTKHTLGSVLDHHGCEDYPVSEESFLPGIQDLLGMEDNMPTRPTGLTRYADVCRRQLLEGGFVQDSGGW